ncbi:MAG: glycosyltransferase [Aquabacterium sp.]|nr:glycosyltransferase [Ferruginibacter sp.]
MKVLSVIASMDPASGGTSEGVRNSIPELERLGVTNEVVCLDDPKASFLGKDKFVITALGPGRGPWCFSKKLLPWIKANLHRFDAVIIQGLWLYPSYATSKAIRSCNKSSKQKGNKAPKLFIMPHGMLDPYFQKAESRKLKALRNWVYWKLIEGRVIKTADKLLFTCKTELLLARKTFRPYKPKGEVVVGYGIEDPVSHLPAGELLWFQKYPELKQVPYLLFLSRIHEKKGVDLLIEALKEILEELALNTEAVALLPKLVIAGPGLETAYGQKIFAMVSASEKLKSSIIFPGMLSGATKWQAYMNCQAFVLPSHQENFGIAVVEALACSKPVLISNQVNIWNEIESAGSGLVASDTKEGTKKLLLKWLVMPEEDKTKMADRARKCFEEKFTISAAAKNMFIAISSN